MRRPQQPSPTPPPSPELLSTADVAAILKVSPRQVLNMKSRGQLPAPTRIAGLGLRWSRGAIDSWIANQVGEVVTKVMNIGDETPKPTRPRRRRSCEVKGAGLRGEENAK